jgi:CRP-like cAMP-binding protein
MGDFFADVPHLLELFEADNNLVKYKKSQTFVRPEDANDWVYLLKSGLVEISCGFSDGSNRLLGYFFPGAVFAQNGSFFSSEGSGLEYTTVIDTELYRIPRQRFFEVLSRDIACSQEYVGILLRNQLLLIERVALMGEKNIDRTVMRLIIGLGTYYGHQDQSKFVVDAPMTQEVIARFVHATRESVSKTLRQLLRQGVITLNKKQLVIHDMAKLESLLNG